MHYIPFLTEVHRRLQPRAYLEVGVREGRSLQLARCRAIGVDPAFAIRFELDNDLALVRSTSDEFFARPDPLALSGGRAFDLSFLDGLHLFEFALRDFVNAERYSTARGVIVFDDVLPRSVDEAARSRHTSGWTGDVYPMIEVLARYRPDLLVVPIGTLPTGLLVVFGLDPENTVLADHYDEILSEFRRPDPQPVPEVVLDRLTVHPPQRFLQTDVLDLLAAAADDAPAALRARLHARTVEQLGRGYSHDLADGASAAAAG